MPPVAACLESLIEEHVKEKDPVEEMLLGENTVGGNTDVYQ